MAAPKGTCTDMDDGVFVLFAANVELMGVSDIHNLDHVRVVLEARTVGPIPTP